MLFLPGQIVATPGALRTLEEKKVDARMLLGRHQSGDWGTVPSEDRRANDWSVRNGGRILSSYPLDEDQRVWIITEADRSVTTILLPDEY